MHYEFGGGKQLEEKFVINTTSRSLTRATSAHKRTVDLKRDQKRRDSPALAAKRSRAGATIVSAGELYTALKTVAIDSVGRMRFAFDTGLDF